MTASIAKMSGFLEVAITYTFHSPLCVRCLRLSGSSAYRRGTCGHLGFIYVQRGRASKFWRRRGREARKISFQLFSHVSFQTVPLPISWFETHPRWPPVTQYAIVGLACEQSSYYHDNTSLEMHREKEFLEKNDTDRKFPFSEEFMRSEKHVKHHSYLVGNEANFLLGEHKIAI